MRLSALSTSNVLPEKTLPTIKNTQHISFGDSYSDKFQPKWDPKGRSEAEIHAAIEEQLRHALEAAHEMAERDRGKSFFKKIAQGAKQLIGQDSLHAKCIDSLKEAYLISLRGLNKMPICPDALFPFLNEALFSSLEFLPLKDYMSDLVQSARTSPQ